MARRCSVVVLLLVALTLPASAQAQGATEGFYLGPTFNLAFDDFDDTGPIDFDEGIGAGVRLGSRLHQNFALEFQYEWTGEFEDSVPVIGFAPDVDLTAEAHVLTANAKLFPLPGRFEPVLFVGLGAAIAEIEASGFGLTVDDDETAFTARFGGGLQGAISESVSVLLEGSYVLPTDGLDDFAYISVNLGLNVHFEGF